MLDGSFNGVDVLLVALVLAGAFFAQWAARRGGCQQEADEAREEEWAWPVSARERTARAVAASFDGLPYTDYRERGRGAH